MITVPELTADALGHFISDYMKRRYGQSDSRLVSWSPRSPASRSNASATATPSTTTSNTPCW